MQILKAVSVCLLLSSGLANAATSKETEALEAKNDMYSQSCVNYLDTAYKWGGSACKGLKKKKLLECVCGLDDFVETSVSCIDSLMTEVPEHTRDSKRNIAYSGLKLQCKKAKVSLQQIETYHANSTALKPYPGSHEAFGKWKAKKAFKVPVKEAEEGYKAYVYNSNAKDKAALYGGSHLIYWFGICLIRAVIHWVNAFFPRTRRLLDNALTRKIRSVFTQPALISKRHSLPLSVFKFPMNIPTREQVLLILGYVALNFGTVFGLALVTPNFKYKNSWSLAFNSHLGIRTGWIILSQMPLAILFAGRNNFLQFACGWSHDTFIVYHKWISRIIAVNVLIHLIAYTVVRVEQGRYTEMWHTPYWHWGIVGTAFLFFVFFQAMNVFRRLSYETFLVLHIIGVILFIVGGYYHVKLLKDWLQYFYAMWAIWGFDRLMRIVRVLVSNPAANAEIKVYEPGVLEISVNYSKFWRIQKGQYAFVHILKPTLFWQSHPFSLTSGVNDDDNDQIKLYCRVREGLTRQVQRMASRSDGVMTTKIWIDGPYGSVHNLAPFNNCIFVAGGIGITAPFSYIQSMIKNESKQNIRLFWAVADEEPLVWFRDQLSYMAKGGVEINLYVAGRPSEIEPSLASIDDNPLPIEDTVNCAGQSRANSYSEADTSSTVDEKKEGRQFMTTNMEMCELLNMHYDRLNVNEIVEDAILKANGSTAVLCCGPGGVNDDARAAVASSLVKSTYYAEYFEEAFSF